MRSVGEWLSTLGLSRYEAVFHENDIDPAVAAGLTADDLIELGVASIGHRRKLLDAIAALKGSTDGAPSDLAGRSGAAGRPRPPPEAERRQLTLMFVDLVGSTALSARLDPEVMGGVIRSYQNAVAGEIARYQGHVAKFMGAECWRTLAGLVRTKTSRSVPFAPASRLSERWPACRGAGRRFAAVSESRLGWWWSAISSARARHGRRLWSAIRPTSPRGSRRSRRLARLSWPTPPGACSATFSRWRRCRRAH